MTFPKLSALKVYVFIVLLHVPNTVQAARLPKAYPRVSLGCRIAVQWPGCQMYCNSEFGLSIRAVVPAAEDESTTVLPPLSAIHPLRRLHEDQPDEAQSVCAFFKTGRSNPTDQTTWGK